MIYASKSRRGFFSEEIFGPLMLTVDDPSWVRPVRDVVLAPGETLEVLGQVVGTNTGTERITLKDVPDWEAVAPQVLVRNALLPVDVRPISLERRAELLACAYGIDWSGDDPTEALPPELNEQEEEQLRVQQFTVAGQNYLDDLARSWGYDNIFTACTYADEAVVPKFQREGQALRKYRSEFWAAASQIQPGPDDTIESLLPQLPEPPARPAA